MTEEVIPDGNNRYKPAVNVMNCFFCLKDKRDCGAFSFDASTDPALQELKGREFAMCPDCAERTRKDRKYPATAIINFLKAERMMKELMNKGLR